MRLDGVPGRTLAKKSDFGGRFIFSAAKLKLCPFCTD